MTEKATLISADKEKLLVKLDAKSNENMGLKNKVAKLKSEKALKKPAQKQKASQV